MEGYTVEMLNELNSGFVSARRVIQLNPKRSAALLRLRVLYAGSVHDIRVQETWLCWAWADFGFQQPCPFCEIAEKVKKEYPICICDGGLIEEDPML